MGKWKLVIENYRDFSRSDLVDERFYVEQMSPRHLVLGGEYSNVDIQTNSFGARLFSVAGDVEMWLPDKYFKPIEVVQPCPFIVGDRVKVRSEEVPDNRKYLLWAFPGLFDDRTLIKIDRVLNRYYVFLSLDGLLLNIPILHTSLGSAN